MDHCSARRVDATAECHRLDRYGFSPPGRRLAAEQITPDPPGIPVPLPGKRLTHEVVEHLTSGVEVGMELPDPGDPSLGTVRALRDAHGAA
jgi:arginine/lysine/ornithine decarboxylase